MCSSDLRAVALARNGGVPNARLPTRAALDWVTSDGAARDLVERAAATGRLGPRSIARIARIARTVADLRGRTDVDASAVAAAVALRAEPFAERLEIVTPEPLG